MSSRKKEISKITLDDLNDKNENNYGLKGSATKVRKIFPPERTAKRDIVIKNGKDGADYILEIFKNTFNSKEENI